MEQKKSIWDECVKLYSLQKTLRFELVPQGKTKEYIEKTGLLQQDEKRAENYKKVKKIIDEYHKKFIEESLSSGLLDEDTLQEFSDLYYALQKEKKKDKKDEKSIEDIQEKLRKQTKNLFENNGKWKSLFSEELIKKELIAFTDDENKRILIREFNKFTTYFTGFHENRKNMYSDEDKSTAIAHRIIHDNLPKFLDNISLYNRIKGSGIDLATIEKELEPVLQGHKLGDIFSIYYFNKTLTQKGIDFYNAISGGIAEKNRNKIRGINEYVNTEYNQKQQDKRNRIPKLSPLYKQILSDRETASFVSESFEQENEMLEAVENFYTNELINYKIDEKIQNIFAQFKQLFQNMQSFDKSKIYLRNDLLSSISKRLFGEWAIIGNALSEWYDRHELAGKKKITQKDNKEKEDWLKQDYVPILIIENALSEYEHDVVKKDECNGLLPKYFASFKKKKEDEKDIIQQIDAEYSCVRNLLNTPYPEGKKLASEEVDVAKIKAFLDALLDFFHFVKPLSIKNPKKNIVLKKDEGFYGAYVPLFEQVDKIIPLYNKVRNHLTKKPYSTEKIKLNFENSTLLNGWDLNKETDNTSVLFRKNGLYYLGIMDTNYNTIFKEIPHAKDGEAVFEKMVYKLLPGANKMLPKVFFSEKGKAVFKPSEDLLTKYKKETHKKGDNFSLNDCHKLIDFFKVSIAKHEDWKHFNHQFSDTSSYADLSGFYREVEKQGYKITFQDVPESYINQLVDEGKLYLFQIYNKDFSPYSKGKPNMHTLYWKMLFDPENLKDVVYKLNGKAEVFFRKASLRPKNTAVHKANEVISNKNPDNEKKQSTFKYDIIKDRRYTVDKFQFHVPITLNFKAEGRDNLNMNALKLLKNNKEVNIIGIDRGERHLLYLTLINQKGKILLQESLNEIVNNYRDKSGKIQEKHTDYHSLLDRREIERDKARRSWELIENIKELKEGYVSQVVHRIAMLMIEYNALVVMEDLNFGFKRGRQKVEKQVYQKFEKMLIEKLNYLVFKDKKADETGGMLNALQLTNKFESFQALGKQSGFIFYVPAALTSKIDPATGFVDFLKPQYESVEKAKSFFVRFEKVKFSTEQGWFELSFNYKDFTDKAEGSKNDWVLCTTKYERFIWDRILNNGKGAQKSVNVNNELKRLFDRENITYTDGKDIKEQILAQQSADFFKKLMKLLYVLVSLRHNNGLKGKEEKDYIISPVEPFFNSLEAKAGEPKDADANGAYHIALKGLWMLQQVDKAEDLRKVKLAMSNKEWLEFAQTQTL